MSSKFMVHLKDKQRVDLPISTYNYLTHYYLLKIEIKLENIFNVYVKEKMERWKSKKSPIILFYKVFMQLIHNKNMLR